jgi:hypothetical protein
MCRNAILHHRDGSETVCRCQADLQQAMPRGIWFFPPAGEPDLERGGFEPGVCLCPVDLDRTARENGYRLSRYAPDGTEDVFDDHLYDQAGREPTTLVVGAVTATRPGRDSGRPEDHR